MATLERCYNNPTVFTGVVKIRKGEAVKMMMEATSMDSVKAIFSHFVTHVSAQYSPSSVSKSSVHVIGALLMTLPQLFSIFYISTIACPAFTMFFPIHSVMLLSQFFLCLDTFCTISLAYVPVCLRLCGCTITIFCGIVASDYSWWLYAQHIIFIPFNL